MLTVKMTDKLCFRSQPVVLIVTACTDGLGATAMQYTEKLSMYMYVSPCLLILKKIKKISSCFFNNPKGRL